MIVFIGKVFHNLLAVKRIELQTEQRGTNQHIIGATIIYPDREQYHLSEGEAGVLWETMTGKNQGLIAAPDGGMPGGRLKR